MPQSPAVNPALVRQSLILHPNPSRVIVRPFKPVIEPIDLRPADKTRANHIVRRVMDLTEKEAADELKEVLENFETRHRNLIDIFETRSHDMEPAFSNHPSFTRTQRLLIGAYFMQEYAFEAAALFNPSIVRHPDQSLAAKGALRFVLSLRAVGEGHISSLTFRAGSLFKDGRIELEDCATLAAIPKVIDRTSCPMGEIAMVRFSDVGDISERVIFPVTMSQTNGIEDARFVEFIEDGKSKYYATYTAYSNRAIRSELIETEDFLSFKMTPLSGTAAVNKGMALFPRKFDDEYAMIGRHDSENLYLLHSKDLYNWDDGQSILQPKFTWEFVQIGNCGSPIEIDEGWLMLIHGVGPVRKYAIGAVLLDKKDPSKVLARSRYPLIRPEPEEREGYVPNVVYTCGAIMHCGRLIIPYAVSDTFSNFASIPIGDLLNSLT